MITVETIKASLDDASTRYDRYAEALKWTVGELDKVPAYLLPPAVGDAGQDALLRLGRRATSAGPRAFQHIRDGTIGEVNWGGDDPQVDKALEALDRGGLAERLFERAAVGGMMVGIVAESETGDLTIRRLGGYVEPITDPYDYDIVRGIAQVTHDTKERGDVRYRVRVYDLTSGTVREWRKLTKPNGMMADAEAVPVPFLPRFRIMQAGPSGLPVGDLQRALPLIQSEWASQVRGDRTEEATGFPQAVIKGEVLSGVEKRGPTNIIEMSPEGDFKFVIPGDLEPMHRHHDRKLERLREELRLPGGSLGAQTPSGEALREAATKFVQMCSRYAEALSGVMTELMADYAVAIGATPVEVVVSINREYEKAIKVDLVIELWSNGLIPLEAAVREIHPFIPTMSSKELEAFIARETRTLPSTLAPSRATPDEMMEEATKERADALKILIEAGVDPAAAARVVGLPGIQFRGTN